MLTRKHFQAIARILATGQEDFQAEVPAATILRQMTWDFATWLRTENSRFDRQRFYDAAKLPRRKEL